MRTIALCVTVAVLSLSGCGSGTSLDVSGSYSGSLLVTSLGASVAHSIVLAKSGSGYLLTISPTDGTAAGALTFAPGTSARAAVGGSSHVLALIMSGPGTVGSFRLGGSSHEIRSGSIDLSFRQAEDGTISLVAALVDLVAEDATTYRATLAP